MSEYVCRNEFLAYKDHVQTLYDSHLKHVTDVERHIEASNRNHEAIEARFWRELRRQEQEAKSARRQVAVATYSGALALVTALLSWFITH